MGWPRRLILLRHGRAVVNENSRDENAELDTPDVAFPLIDFGEAQCMLTSQYVNNEYPDIDVIMSSPHKRARSSARIFFPNRRILQEPRLTEMRIGMWTMFTRAQIEAMMPREIARYEAEGLYHYKPFGGDSGPDVELRIHSLLATLRMDYDGAVVACVTHHQWLVLFQRVIDGISIKETERRLRHGQFYNASVTAYEPKIVDGRPWLAPTMVNHVPWKGRLSTD
ncbi:MAG: histidine phosphatase family protein [Patescibacteria group bacterium]|nr:histidine phosphatase family protein [Patescibacteria group bacterium]